VCTCAYACEIRVGKEGHRVYVCLRVAQGRRSEGRGTRMQRCLGTFM
jgi:hypothetical protein